MIVGDAEKLRMVIDNLLSNAYKYTDEKGIITLKLSQHPATEQVVITVTDNGIGISKTGITKLFKRFGRISNALSAKAGGCGLGLYLADGIVALHGGIITVTSVVSKGSTFKVTLPKNGGKDG
jgi:two-component system sensor histidine kinase VicK